MKNLYVYFSFTGRTHQFVQEAAEKDNDAVLLELNPINLPIAPITIPTLLLWNLCALFGWPIAIHRPDLPEKHFRKLVIGSPTWMGKPAGPVLYFLKNHLPEITFQEVHCIISCRKDGNGTVEAICKATDKPVTSEFHPYEGSTLESIKNVLNDLTRKDNYV